MFLRHRIDPKTSNDRHRHFSPQIYSRPVLLQIRLRACVLKQPESPHSEPSRRSVDLQRHFRPSRCSLLSRSDVDCELQRGRRSCMGFYGFVPLFVPTVLATQYPCRQRARCRIVIDKLTWHIFYRIVNTAEETSQRSDEIETKDEIFPSCAVFNAIVGCLFFW